MYCKKKLLVLLSGFVRNILNLISIDIKVTGYCLRVYKKVYELKNFK